MPFDAELAERLRKRLGKRKGVTEKQMFGGIAFLLRGNMCCGVHGDELIVRLDPAETPSALKKPHTRPFDLTGRPMQGWILVGQKGLATEVTLGEWVNTAAEYAASLPPK
ncbi:MAG TPA: TfoX/Sxy family protein [Gemmatimonadaceae bacterium]|jgi:hypothetical protein|nr:TfoX/Sxy family protein [Gemmatimonadaceae bacterium]